MTEGTTDIYCPICKTSVETSSLTISLLLSGKYISYNLPTCVLLGHYPPGLMASISCPNLAPMTYRNVLWAWEWSQTPLKPWQKVPVPGLWSSSVREWAECLPIPPRGFRVVISKHKDNRHVATKGAFQRNSISEQMRGGDPVRSPWFAGKMVSLVVSLDKSDAMGYP